VLTSQGNLRGGPLKRALDLDDFANSLELAQEVPWLLWPSSSRRSSDQRVLASNWLTANALPELVSQFDARFRLPPKKRLALRILIDRRHGRTWKSYDFAELLIRVAPKCRCPNTIPHPPAIKGGRS
jgi:hypothetical protein